MSTGITIKANAKASKAQQESISTIHTYSQLTSTKPESSITGRANHMGGQLMKGQQCSMAMASSANFQLRFQFRQAVRRCMSEVEILLAATDGETQKIITITWKGRETV